MASVNIRGAEPNQIYVIRIHGKLNGKDAECPTTAANTNHDNLKSVFEGAFFLRPDKS